MPDQDHESSPRRFNLTPRGWLLVLLVNVSVLLLLGWPTIQARFMNTVANDVPTDTVEPNSTMIVSPTPTLPTQIPSATPVAVTPVISDVQPGFFILSLKDGLDTHLFAYRPLAEETENILPLTRLTDGPWHDIAPALSPDGTQIAFASNRDGQWDLYLWRVKTGEINRLTHTPEYESSPSWSPDSSWLVYTRYIDNNLELVIDPIVDNANAIQLTQHLAADHSPVWSPLGRQIAFVSTRGGHNQIWLANLDQNGEDRFHLLSQTDELTAQYPDWSKDGKYLAWATITEGGTHRLMVWDSTDPHAAPQPHGSGDRPTWSQDGQTLFATLETPYQTYLVGYPFDHPDGIVLPPVAMPGAVDGLLWANVSLAALVPNLELPSPTPLQDPDGNLNPETPGGRWG
ncbi:MAG: PD40 domain-containing protein, partial [Chloroflexi bacterium]|nr:PD40 domain-containing protein [Chloroflexota bacterium]